MTVSITDPHTATPPERSRTTRLGPYASIVLTTPERGPATAAVAGEIDMATCAGLCAELCGAVDQYAPTEHGPVLLLDLAAVDFFDCAALQALDRARHHAGRRNCRLVIERSSEAVDLVLGLVGAPAWNVPRYLDPPVQSLPAGRTAGRPF